MKLYGTWTDIGAFSGKGAAGLIKAAADRSDNFRLARDPEHLLKDILVVSPSG